MKSINHLLTVLFAVASVTLQAQTRSVELPPVAFANTRSVEISKVVLSDTATVLDIEASYTPGYWIKIVTDSYLQADGKKYMIRSGQGIELDSLFWMPKSGEASFKLVFDPLPENTRTFDFIESDCEDCFKLYGINLVNKRLKLPPIPAEFSQKHPSKNNYRSGLEKGEATVSGKLLGYTPVLGDFSLIYHNPITGVEQKKPLSVQPDGSFTTSATVYGPAFALISGKMLYAPIRIAPGKESKIVVNLPEIYRADSRLFKNHEPYGKKYYYAGYFAGLNTDLANSGLSQALRQDYQNEIADMNPAQYKDFITEKYREAIAHNTTLDLSPLARKIASTDAVFELFDHLEMADYTLTQAYAKKHNLSREEAMKNLVPVARTDEFNDYYLKIPYIDPDVLLATNISHRVERLVYSRGSMGDRFEELRYLSDNAEVSPEDRRFFKTFIAASEKGEEFENAASVGDVYNKYRALASEFMKTRMGEGYLAKIWNTDDAFLLNLVKSMKISSSIRDFNPLTDEQKEGLNPFPSVIRQALLEQNEELLARIEENKKKTGFTVLNPPANVDEQLFVDMLTPFKGKVILVDVWATWCGPCRMANAQMEPVKAQFSDKDVVFLYLAGENSPENTWKNMITDMKGHHYRVNQAQWDYLSNSLNVRGVPTYIIIDRTGNHTFHTSGFPGVDTMKRELMKVLKK